MTEKNKGATPSNVTYLKTKKKKGGKAPSAKGTSDRPKSKADLFITDDRFKRAMELIKEDMNQSFALSQTAQNQSYFLFKFLVKNGLVDEKKYEKFLEEELGNIKDNEN